MLQTRRKLRLSRRNSKVSFFVGSGGARERPRLSRRDLRGGFGMILAQNAVPRGGASHPKRFCPRQRSCPGQVASSRKNEFSAESSAPGSEAAQDKWLVQKSLNFEEKLLPQAAKLPGTSGLFKKSHILRKSSAPGSEAARDKWLVE